MPRGEPVRRLHEGFLPGRHAIDAYGNGGFRFGEMSHRGSILALPSGIHAWQADGPEAFTPEMFAAVLAEREAIDVLLVGAGRDMAVLPAALGWMFREARIGVDVMATGAAARTYNIMLGEGRQVAAALVAID
ncbi:Mth938-like domain-containing protein [Phreatobacter sp.]|uniref:Mth938-like domain-containing protein n=1 Tax=Phreatobacter sp. TaxID=1966341 RepID=UPI003F6EC786